MQKTESFLHVKIKVGGRLLRQSVVLASSTGRLVRAYNARIFNDGDTPKKAVVKLESEDKRHGITASREVLVPAYSFKDVRIDTDGIILNEGKYTASAKEVFD